MAKRVQIDGVGEIEFPDSMSDREIETAIETEILPQAGRSAPSSRPGSVAARARQRLVARGTSPERVKARAAVGLPVDERPPFVEPTPFEALATSTSALVSGAARGAASLVTIPADAATDLVTAGPARRALAAARKKLRGGKIAADDLIAPAPRTELAAAAAEDLRRTMNRAAGVRPNTINDVAEAGYDFVGDTLAQSAIPDLAAGRTPELKPQFRPGELVERRPNSPTSGTALDDASVAQLGAQADALNIADTPRAPGGILTAEEAASEGWRADPVVRDDLGGRPGVFGWIASSPDAEKVYAHLPSGTKVLQMGEEAVVVSLPNGNVARIGRSSAVNRPPIPEVLQPIHTEKVGNWTIEELPRVEAFNRVPPGVDDVRAGIAPAVLSDAELSQLQQQIRARGYEFDDVGIGNVGRTSDGRLVVIDANAVRKIEDVPAAVENTPPPPNNGSGASMPTAPDGGPTTPAPYKFGWYTRLREAVDDDWRRVKQLVDDPKTVVTKDGDPYQAEILSHGRMGTRVEEAWGDVAAIDRDLVITARGARVSPQDMQADVDAYLHARHAPERNATLGDGAAGLTTVDAQSELARIAALPHGAEVVRLADKLQEINNRTLDVLRDGGLITDELYESLRNKYQHHVPLNRIMADAEEVVSAIAGRSMDVRSSGIRAAHGSQRQVADITANIVTNYEQAIVRAEKNRVNLATLEFARNNPQLDLFSESRPRAIGMEFDGVTPVMKQRANDLQTLSLFENGKAIDLRIKDPGLALALKGIGRERVTGIFRVAQTFTRFMANLATRFNPDFFAPNKIRDLQEVFVYLFSQKDIGVTGATKTLARDVASWKDVIDGIRGADTAGARLYQQMRRDGGTTGGLGLSSRKAVEIQIEEIRRLNRSAPRMAARKLVQYLDALNQIFEDSSRLSVYKTALEKGVGRERAAQLAKESSINFNKFGRFGPQVNALYMFSNASIQGTAKMARAMKNPKVAGTVTLAIGAAVGGTAEWNDRIDPDWRTKVPKFDRLSTLPIVLPPSEDGAFNYIKIPVSWGIKPLKVAWDYAMDAYAEKSNATPGEAVAETAKASVEAVNPLGGTDALSAATPTALDLPVDIGRNRAWHGGMIGPDPAWDETMPESQRYFRNLPNSLTGRLAVETTNELSERGIEVSPADLKYAVDTLGGGSGRFATKVINTMTAIGKGEAPDVNELPFISRFVESVPPERMEAQRRSQLREKAKQAEKNARRRIRQQQIAD